MGQYMARTDVHGYGLRLLCHSPRKQRVQGQGCPSCRALLQALPSDVPTCCRCCWKLCRRGLVGEELVDLLDRAVLGHDGVAVVVHVENEVLAHDSQSNQGNITSRFHSC